MYFDEEPKTSRLEMFNYSEEFDKLLSSLSDGRRMIVIKGRRRTGKTSLLLSGLNELKKPYLVIDWRVFAGSAQIRREEFIKILEETLNKFLKKERRLGSKILDALKHIQGVEVTGGAEPGVALRWGPRPSDAVNISSVFDAISDEARKQKIRFIIAFDEAQELRKIMRYDLISVLAHAYDYCKGLQFVVTGSEIGMLYKFLNVEDAKSPLYGRAMVEIELKGLDREKSMEYLRSGFRQIRMKVSDDMLERIHERFDGIVGWLTYAGFKAREARKIDGKVLEETAKKASRIVAGEFKNFRGLHNSERYRIIVKHLARGKSSWTEIKSAVEVKEGVSIGQGNITKLLSTLEDAGFVARDNEKYFIPDPMLIEATKEGLI